MMSTANQDRKVCLACGSGSLVLQVDFGEMPLAGGFMKPEEIPFRNKSYPLRLARCSACTLMQVLNAVPPESIFHQYSYETSASQTAYAHFTEMGGEIVKTYSAQGRLVVEFGCNDGVLIKSMSRAGAHVVGVDPSDVAKRASQRDGWELINEYFDEAVARQILVKHGHASIIVGNNVFAHVADLHTVLRGVFELLQEEGRLIIEVSYQGDLLEKKQFDTVYHEHIYYYSLTSLVHLFLRHNLQVIDVQRFPVHSGSIRVTAAKKSAPCVSSLRVSEMLETEKKLDVAQFSRNVARYRQEFHDFIENLKNNGKSIGAYGAAGRMTILLNYCGLGPGLIDYVVDRSPLRYGRIVPGVLLPIITPESFRQRPCDYMIMTAWSYETEILAREQEYLKNGGSFIIPLPEVRIIKNNSRQDIAAGS